MYSIVSALFCQRSTPCSSALSPGLDSRALPVGPARPQPGGSLSQLHRGQSSVVTIDGVF